MYLHDSKRSYSYFVCIYIYIYIYIFVFVGLSLNVIIKVNLWGRCTQTQQFQETYLFKMWTTYIEVLENNNKIVSLHTTLKIILAHGLQVFDVPYFLSSFFNITYVASFFPIKCQLKEERGHWFIFYFFWSLRG